MSIRQRLYVLLAVLSTLSGCTADYRQVIGHLELSIASQGVVVNRLESMKEVPVDSYIPGVSVKLGTAEVDGILKGLPDQRYVDALNVINSSVQLYPKNILETDLDSINIGGRILTEREQYTSGFFQPKSQDVYIFPLVADALNIDSDSDVCSTFHHEFSSILMRKYMGISKEFSRVFNRIQCGGVEVV